VIDKEKLEALRAKYAEGKGSDVFDPEFKKVVSLVFQGADRRKLPYGDVATLLDAPYRADAQEAADFAGLDVALIGVPMDLGVTNRAGARLGPRAVRAVERIGPYNHALKVVPQAECKVADIGDVPLRSRFSRSFGDISDPQIARRQAPGRARPYRRALRHLGRV
jgi:guanidinopropionase